MIHEFLIKNNGKARKQDIIDAFGGDDETARIINEKLSMMERFGLITIKGEEVEIKPR